MIVHSKDLLIKKQSLIQSIDTESLEKCMGYVQNKQYRDKNDVNEVTLVSL